MGWWLIIAIPILLMFSIYSLRSAIKDTIHPSPYLTKSTRIRLYINGDFGILVAVYLLYEFIKWMIHR